MFCEIYRHLIIEKKINEIIIISINKRYILLNKAINKRCRSLRWQEFNKTKDQEEEEELLTCA